VVDVRKVDDLYLHRSQYLTVIIFMVINQVFFTCYEFFLEFIFLEPEW